MSEYPFLMRAQARISQGIHDRWAKGWIRRYGIVLRPGSTDAAQLQDVTRNMPYSFSLKKFPSSIVDLGANVGFASLALAQRWPGIPLIAIEPEPGNYQALVHNTARIAHITTLQKAVTPFPERPLYCHKCGGEWGYVFSTDAPSQSHATDSSSEIERIKPCEISSIPSFVPGNALLKVNISGLEHELFAGDLDWLNGYSAVAIRITHPLGDANMRALDHAFFKMTHGK